MLTVLLSAQQKKEVPVKYISEEITLDAVLDEPGWSTTQPAANFWQYFPTDSVQARNQTEIRFLFDDRFLYVGIKVYAIGNDDW